MGLEWVTLPMILWTMFGSFMWVYIGLRFLPPHALGWFAIAHLIPGGGMFLLSLIALLAWSVS